ncbi:glycosyltransferase [Longimicrobium sp.]|uniref:glycosyltransferase n=1 Tax=Longimicrobium sp. TaxID=2029185 RepID=UPI002E32F7CE|nr:glycosyltransferase [Longimicrobium sp.]HEX6039718.1 glycosyltransferase [Longimicrobium sp.]
MTGPAARPLTVVHLITGLNRGGAEMFLARLVGGLDRGRFRNVVVSLTDEGDVAPFIRAAGVPVHALGMRRGVPGPGALVRLVALLRRERPDVLQTWLYHADLAGLLAGRVAGVPAVAWNLRCSDTAGAGGPSLLLRALRALSSRPDVVVVNSRTGWHHHARLGYRPRGWALIGNGVDVDAFRPSPAARTRLRAELGIGSGAPVVGMVARWDPLKDHGTFVRAAGRLHAARPDAVFVLAGRGVNGGNEALRAQLEGAGLDGSVRLLGPRDDLSDLYPVFDVAALTSTSEGFPNVVVEAMACGVPCVVTDAGDAAAIVDGTGAVVPPGDDGAVAAAWARLLDLPADERAALGRAARARVVEAFSLEAALRSYEALYARLGRRPAAPALVRAGRLPEPETTP